MYKVIKQGEELLITGQNIYPGGDTFVYWNSISDSNVAEIVPDSFVDDYSQCKITIPCCLDEYNSIILCTKGGCVTGQRQYKFVGEPMIDSVYPSGQFWGQNFIAKGKYLKDLTSIYLGDQEVTDYDYPSDKKIVFKAPDDFVSGTLKVTTDVGTHSTTEPLEGTPPSIQGNILDFYNKVYGDQLTIQGRSLNKVNRVKIQGLIEEIYLELESLEHSGSTELTFEIPEGTLNNSTVTLQNKTETFENGDPLVEINEEFTLPEQIGIDSINIYSIDKTADVYGGHVTISGNNVENSNIYFLGYNDNYIEAPFVSSGENRKVVSVPKHIKMGKVIASGDGVGAQGVGVSAGLFYPLPTIHSISSTDLTMGESVDIEAINASEIFEGVGISGLNLINNVNGIHFISNPAASQDSLDYFGSINIDNTDLITSPVSGYTRVSALINSVMAGEGNVFLVSTYEALDTLSASKLDETLSGSLTYEKFSDIKGPQVTVSGKSPRVLGLNKYRTSRSGELTVSGSYFFGVTGVKLSGPSQVRKISSDQLNNLSFPSGKVAIVNTGDVNNYEQLHYLSLNLEDFNFNDKSGEFSVLTPYYV